MKKYAMPQLLMLLTLICGAVQAVEQGRDLVKTGQFFFPRLQFQCREEVAKKWDIWPQGDQRLRDALKGMTNINVLTDPVVVNLDHPEQLYQYPYVFMTSEGNWLLTDSGSKNLRDYLLRGGFLYADDCTLNQSGDVFYQSYCKEMKRIFPDQVVKAVPLDHEVFTCFYKLDHVPIVQGKDHPAMGVFDKQTGRLMSLCTSGDVHCGWVGWGNLNQAECGRCVQFGINVVVYSLTH